MIVRRCLVLKVVVISAYTLFVGIEIFPNFTVSKDKILKMDHSCLYVLDNKNYNLKVFGSIVTTFLQEPFSRAYEPHTVTNEFIPSIK